MKLDSVQVKNLRCFKDSGEIELADLNVFIGPNNAGKSTLLGAIELLFRSSSTPDPLALAEHAAFASFSSVVRNNWGPSSPKPTSIEISAKWGFPESLIEHLKQETSIKPYSSLKVTYDCKKHPARADTMVARVEYRPTERKDSLVLEADADDPRLFFVSGWPKEQQYPVMFYGHTPMMRLRGGDKKKKRSAYEIAEFLEYMPLYRTSPFVIIRPMRPVPRTVYVLDDPLLTPDQRELVTELLRIFSHSEKQDERTKTRIIESFRLMGLADNIQVLPVSSKSRQVAEIRVASKSARSQVTIADVGFGVSQVLPLITSEASLSEGNLIAYQPEVHLHPFAQSRLGDIFINSIQRGNRVFVETHSIPLVLRLQTLIAKGEVAPDRVKVYCVECDGDSSRVRGIKFDEKGSPKIKWPSGFLDTNLLLAKELAESRLRNV